MTRRFRAWHRLGAGVLAILSLFALTTVPGSAAPTGTKYFKYEVSTASPVTIGQQDVIFNVKITNTSPKQSSSNIGSVSIVLPAEFTNVSAIAIDPSSTNGDNSTATKTVGSGGTFCQQGTSQQVNVCNIAQIKAQKFIVVSITADVTGSLPSCGVNTSEAWIVRANTGTQLNGDDFTIDPQQTDPVTTTIGNACTLAFDPAPVDAAVNTPIPVGVKVLDGSNNEITTNRTVELSVPGATVTGSPDSTYPFTFSVSGSSADDYTATASSAGLTSITADFTLFDPSSSISGQKWRDHDNDGQRDADERGLEGWTIGAYQDGSLVASDTTDDDGNYTITGLSAGETYTVCEIAPAEEPGFEYRGWIQSVPADPDDVCADVAGAEPNGYTVTFPGGTGSSETDVDFFNVRTITIPGNTITVECADLPDPPVFTVGDGITDPIGTIEVDPDACKPGEYVFETWVDEAGEQHAEFYPTFPPTGVLVPFVETYEWVIDGDRSQQTLYYDDDPNDATGFREMLFCVVDASGDFAAFPEAESGPDHTSCLLNTTEDPTEDGVLRFDTVYTEIDGARRLA